MCVGSLHGCVNEEVISRVKAWQRADLSKEENEEKRERTIKRRTRSREGGGRNEVKAIGKKKKVKRTAEQRAGSGVGRGLVCDEDQSNSQL